MSWFDWFKAKAGGSPEGDAPAARVGPNKVSGSAPSRRARQGGDSYAREWVRVLDDSAPGRDPFSTYTWELDADSKPPARPSSAAVQPPVVDAPAPAARQPAASESEPDPWGLGETGQKKTHAGVNPYDTGVFHAGWGDRSKAR
jgi:hypothetical protein